MALGRMKNPRALQPWGSLNSGDRIRTCDLRVMSPTSYQTALPRGSPNIIHVSVLPYRRFQHFLNSRAP